MLKKGRILVLVVLMIIMNLNVQAATNKLGAGEKKYCSSVGVIVAFADKEETEILAIGNACYIGNGLYVTVDYNILDAKSVWYTDLENKEYYQIEGLVKYDEELGLVILKGKEKPTITPIAVSSAKNANLGKNVTMVCTNEDLVLYSQNCKVNSFSKEKNVIIIGTNNEIPDGATGGALLDKNGKLIGITYGSYEGENLSVGIDLIKESIDYLLKQPFSKIYSKSMPTSGEERETVKVDKDNPNDLDLNFNVTDYVAHPTQPVIYFTDQSAKKVYKVNYETNEIKGLSVSLPPESITFANGKVYVGLLGGKHDSYIEEEDQKGNITVIEPETFKITSQFNIPLDPYDIVVDENDFIYLPSGSSQWTNIMSFSPTSKQKQDQAMIRQECYAIYNKVLSKIYTITTDSSPRDYTTYPVSNGKFTEKYYDSPYHGDYELTRYFDISPQGEYLFNGSGVIFKCTNSKETDMTYVTTLNQKFNAITFDGNSRFFTSVGKGQIYSYNYSTLQGIGTYSAQNDIYAMIYRNNKLICITADDLSEETTKYHIEIVNVK